MNFHEPPKNDAEREELLSLVADQVRQVIKCGDNWVVTCVCGKKVDHLHAWRCFHCGIWFCYQCSVVHFGKPKV